MASRGGFVESADTITICSLVLHFANPASAQFHRQPYVPKRSTIYNIHLTLASSWAVEYVGGIGWAIPRKDIFGASSSRDVTREPSVGSRKRACIDNIERILGFPRSRPVAGAPGVDDFDVRAAYSLLALEVVR
jgi:hypothetical protein